MRRAGILVTATTVLAALTLWNSHAQTKATASEYRKWTQVNAKPLQMASQIATLCAAPSPRLGSIKDDPHNMRFFVVYVNSVGKNAMLKQPKPEFPVGTVIVKEKLPLPANAPKPETFQTTEWKGKAPYPKPELLTVMRKREKGYYLAGGDWEYSVMDGTGQKTLKAGKLEACASCHAQYTGTDWVTRNYLPDSVVRTLYPKTLLKPR